MCKIMSVRHVIAKSQCQYLSLKCQMKGWEPEWSNYQNIVFEIIDVEVYLVDQKQWSVRIVHGW